MVIIYFIKLNNPYNYFKIYSKWVYFETNIYKIHYDMLMTNILLPQS